eukprot:NODE_963_length_1201_cov_45.570312_g725_i0.p1 GENE.NODE_963_length_1201_cov_45.570312_g725_i0~~NODE_963_length_1201_cov_45.570312_g725_i0.p1  ORF type:complete len:312 (-),score=53.87 NODE_963_length_1201_cov_45.570312_g725_i0:183-1118(-)
MGQSESRFLIKPLMGNQYLHAPASGAYGDPIELAERDDKDSHEKIVIKAGKEGTVELRFDKHPQPRIGVSAENVPILDAHRSEWKVVIFGVKSNPLPGEPAAHWSIPQSETQLDWRNAKGKTFRMCLVNVQTQQILIQGKTGLTMAPMPLLNGRPHPGWFQYMTFEAECVGHNFNKAEATLVVIGVTAAAAIIVAVAVVAGAADSGGGGGGHHGGIHHTHFHCTPLFLTTHSSICYPCGTSRQVSDYDRERLQGLQVNEAALNDILPYSGEMVPGSVASIYAWQEATMIPLQAGVVAWLKEQPEEVSPPSQ